MENIILHALFSLSFRDRGAPLPPPVPEGEVCYGLLGCFSVEPPWAATQERPVAVLPKPLNITTPVFCLHTPSQPKCHELLAHDMGSVYRSDLNQSAPLFFITHGYMETATLPWMVEMKEALLTVSPNVGVVTVDWTTAAHPPYAQAVANIRVAGSATGYLINLLAELYDVPLSSVHLIGHSLGAHFMSYAGDFVKNERGEKVARITGLDPAGPYFINTPPEVRLDPSDAEFVDVLHTDIPEEFWEINRLGHPDAMGHVDYYPNGGFKQAGCMGSAHARIKDNQSVADGFISYIGCNHQRSHTFFTESVTSKCQFQGVACDSWEKYLQGLCWGCSDGQCSTMGFHATLQFSGNINLYENNQTSGVEEFLRDDHTQNVASNNTVEQFQTNSDNNSAFPNTVYLGTNSDSPYCDTEAGNHEQSSFPYKQLAEQYRISVWTSAALLSQESEGDVARFTVKLRSLSKELTIPPPKKATYLQPGDKVSWLGFSEHLGPLTALQVDYEEDQGFLHSIIWRFNPPTLYIDYFIVEELSTGFMTQFPFCGSKMEAGESYVLFPERLCYSELISQPPSETLTL